MAPFASRPTLLTGVGLLFCCLTSPALAEIFHAQSLGSGGIQVFADQGLLSSRGNPALLPKESKSRWHIASGLGLYINDREALIDGFDEVDRAGRELEANTAQRPLLPGDEERLVAALEAMDGRRFNAHGGIMSIAALPLRTADLDVAISSSTTLRTAARFRYNPEDAETLRFATVLGILDLNDLQSTFGISGVVHTDTGVTLAGSFPGYSPLRAGITLKHQAIRIIQRELQIDEFEEDKLFDRQRDLRRTAHANIDIGFSQSWGPWHAAVAVRNIFPKTFRGPQQDNYHLRPSSRLALGYDGDRWRYGLDVDLVPEKGFDVLDDWQKLRLGLGRSVSRRVELRAGYQYMIRGFDNDSLTLGIGLRRGKRVQLDLALQLAERDEIGGSGQLRVRF